MDGMTDEHVICSRCVTDTTFPGVSFDSKGVCNYCHAHDMLDREFPLDDSGKERLEKIIQKMKKSGRNRKYDCIVGVSGGRDSSYTLHLLVKTHNLRPLAVHFNDGFGNPTAGENMKKAVKKLGVDLVTVTSDWRESKDLKIAFLKASTPDLEVGTDVGIASALYGIAAREGIPYVVWGQSFRTEGISPLEWNYLDGRYLNAVHKRFGSIPLRPWKPDNPGFNLGLRHIFYYTIIKGIRAVPLLYYYDYVRTEASEVLEKELDWVYPGAHYWDDLYQSLMTYVLRTKFNIDRRKFNYSALVRSGQMTRSEALNRIGEIYVIEDQQIIDLCIKRLGITREEFESYLQRPPKTFRDYPSNYNFIRLMKIPIWIVSRLGIVPGSTYAKYFKCG